MKVVSTIRFSPSPDVKFSILNETLTKSFFFFFDQQQTEETSLKRNKSTTKQPNTFRKNNQRKNNHKLYLIFLNDLRQHWRTKSLPYIGLLLLPSILRK